LQESAQMVGVANEFRGWLGDSKQLCGACDVCDVAAGQQQCMRATFAIDERVDLGRPATARAADGLLLIALFTGDLRAPADDRCAFTAELSIVVTGRGPSHPARVAKMTRRRHRGSALIVVLHGNAAPPGDA
jgi:hypothetical protein